MPFDNEYDEDFIKEKIVGKNVSSQKSIFDGTQKKPTPAEFDKKVKKIQETGNSYKLKAAELASKFNKAMKEKILTQNKNVFQNEIENELLSDMIQFSIDLNNDPSEPVEGMGSVSLITLLLRACFFQRDKINNLEFRISKLEEEKNNSVLDKK